mmetsp:Transcript_8890/g.15669  ORF Transcript_8890/g.15669 Transcript_8890/m.15669 type:complete len:415 (-) Transcript_8890:45-1289(-)
MLLSMKPSILVLALAVTAAAWTAPISHPSVSHRSTTELMSAKEPEDQSLDRRNFFQAATTKAATLSLLVASSTVSTLDVANAADSTTSYSKIYQPAPHSMDGKLVVITGGNAGLGLESSKRLAEAGATVVFTSRDDAKGQKALTGINESLKQQKADDETFAGKVMVASLDLCDLDNVKSFQERLVNVIGKDVKIDVLLNNAGVMAIPDLRLTKDGYEKTFQTNHLGHFALTSTLLPLLSSHARVINVSSQGYLFASKNGLELDNLNGEREYGPWSSYGQSKLENILFTNELQKRAQNSESHSNLTAFSLHPGAVQTDLARYIIGEEKFISMKENGFSNWKDKLVMESLAKFVLTVQEGASTQVFLASQDVGSLEAGKFFDAGKVTAVQAFAADEAKGVALWDVSEKLSGVKFEL